jgi:predicted nucleic acid-binding protein
MVVGELAMGNLKNRTVLLAAMRGLPIAPVATHDEVSQLIEIRVLYGRGLSLIDAHLLASVLLAPGTLLWTRDRRLRDMAEQFGVEYST